jgi:drug/metabolite transporter (DMT)-like permease
VNPAVAVFLGWLFRGEHIDRYMVIGMIVIIGAVVLVTTSKLRSARRVTEEQNSVCQATAD